MTFWERLDSPRHRRGCASIGCPPRGFPLSHAPGDAWSAACSYGTSRRDRDGPRSCSARSQSPPIAATAVSERRSRAAP